MGEIGSPGTWCARALAIHWSSQAGQPAPRSSRCQSNPRLAIARLLAATLLTRAGFRPELDRLRDALALIFLGALLSMTVSATVGTVALASVQRTSTAGFLGTWSVWWTGDAMGVLVVAPFLFTLR